MDTAQDREIRETLADLSDCDHYANVGDVSSLHPFPARMPLPLAEHLLKSLVAKKASVLDPMTGSGSTLVAARKFGHTGHGVDIDPLAVLISRSATTSYRRSFLEKLCARLLTRAKEVHAALPRTSVPNMLRLSDEEKRFIKYWFPNNTQRQLHCLGLAIREESESAPRNIAWSAFSSLIIAKSTSVSYAIDVPRSRPHKHDERDIDPPFEVWNRRFTQMMNRLPFLDKNIEAAEPEIEEGDARILRHDSDSFDLVLTSPPYRTAIDYLRGHKFSLIWMGHSLSSLRKTRGTMIGCERGMWKPNGLPPSMEQDLSQVICEDRVRAITRRYLSDLHYSMLEMRRVVKPDGLIALVLGPNILDRNRADSIKVTRLLAESLDLRVVASVLRPLRKERRSLPPPDTVSKRTELASRMSCEAIVVLRNKKKG